MAVPSIGPSEAGFSIGPYRIASTLGRGGMGVVYRGEHPGTGERVAVKTVRAASASLVSGIRREFLALSRLRHPGVARIVGEGIHDGLPYFAMELYEGETLRGQLDRLWGRPREERSGVREITATLSGHRLRLRLRAGLARRVRRDGAAPRRPGARWTSSAACSR